MLWPSSSASRINPNGIAIRSSIERRWCDAALQAQSADDFWCRGKLAEGVVDLRFTQRFEMLPNSTVIDQYRLELYRQLVKAAENRSKGRKETLFGQKAPS